MATFPNITPSYGAQKNSSPKLRTVFFGDGYENRFTFGLNQNPKQSFPFIENKSKSLQLKKF